MHSLMGSAPGWCTIKKLNFGHLCAVLTSKSHGHIEMHRPLVWRDGRVYRLEAGAE